MDVLAQAAALAKKERGKRGRSGYSSKLQDAIRAAAGSHSKAAIKKATGISYPTITKIVGRTTKAARGSRTRAASVASVARNGNVTVRVSINLPSGVELSYSSLEGLRKDARTLQEAVDALS